MYENFYDLDERPFSPSPDPRYLLLTPDHREALTQIECGITERQPLTLLVGPPGTGKTTLLRAAAERCRASGHLVVSITNPSLSRAEWNEWLAAGFGLDGAAAGSRTRCLRELQDLLVERLQRGAGAALIVDEAQALSAEVLEEVRQLANLETSTTKLLPIVLAGTPELGDRLRQVQHAALKQRVTLRSAIAPLDLEQTAAYIEGRIRIAGGSGVGVFTTDAVREIYRRSGGVPRLINLLCENALITGFALSLRPIEPWVICEVGGDFELPEPVAAVAAGVALGTSASAPWAQGRPAGARPNLTFAGAVSAAAPPAGAHVPMDRKSWWTRCGGRLGLFAFPKRG